MIKGKIWKKCILILYFKVSCECMCEHLNHHLNSCITGHVDTTFWQQKRAESFCFDSFSFFKLTIMRSSLGTTGLKQNKITHLLQKSRAAPKPHYKNIKVFTNSCVLNHHDKTFMLLFLGSPIANIRPWNAQYDYMCWQDSKDINSIKGLAIIQRCQFYTVTPFKIASVTQHCFLRSRVALEGHPVSSLIRVTF